MLHWAASDHQTKACPAPKTWSLLPATARRPQSRDRAKGSQPYSLQANVSTDHTQAQPDTSPQEAVGQANAVL